MTPRWRFVLLVSLIGTLTVAYVGYKAWEYRNHINFWLDKYMYVVDEFSERDQFAAANIPLRSDTLVDRRIVFFGTQVTANWPLEKYFSDFQAINRGVDGQRAAGFLLRFRPDVIELHPEAVVIEVSSYNFRPNTTAKEMFDYVASMAELARANGIQPIITTAIPPRSDYVVDEHEDYRVRDTVAAYSAWLETYAASHGFALADWRRAVADSNGFLRPELSVSKVDLNEQGYEAISRTVRAALERLEKDTLIDPN